MKFSWPIAGGIGGALALAMWGVQNAFADDGSPAPPVKLPGLPSSGGSGISYSSDEIEALHRVIASEAGSGTHGEMSAIAWTVRNRFRGKSIYDVEFPWRAQYGSKPPFSSAREGTPAHWQLAAEVLQADQSADPTGGATAFFEPKMQDAFFKAGELARAGETGDRTIDGVKLKDITRFKNYKLDADGVRKRWEPGDTVYAKAGRFEFWGNAKLFAQRNGQIKTIVGADHGLQDQAELARVIENAGGVNCAEQQAVAWTMRNRAARNCITVSEACRLIDGTNEPSAWSRAVAGAVLCQPMVDDPTSGAVDFWRPNTQRHGRALGDLSRTMEADNDLIGAAEYAAFRDYKSEAAVREEFERNGMRIVGVVGTLELLG